jgi:hypothetical protein
MGVYDYNASTTWKPSFLAKFAPDTTNNSGSLSGAVLDLTGDTLVSDVIRISQDTSLPNFPIDVTVASGSRRNMLGVGPNSSVLGYLRNSKKIKSNVWSYFEGLYGLQESENMDGHVIFGGYDAAKIRGAAFTQRKSTSAQGCPTNLVISVSDVSLDINGESLSLVGNLPGLGIQMCIDPSFKLLSFPLQVWRNFKQSAGGAEVSVHDPGIIALGRIFAADTL